MKVVISVIDTNTDAELAFLWEDVTTEDGNKELTNLFERIKAKIKTMQKTDDIIITVKVDTVS